MHGRYSYIKKNNAKLLLGIKMLILYKKNQNFIFQFKLPRRKDHSLLKPTIRPQRLKQLPNRADAEIVPQTDYRPKNTNPQYDLRLLHILLPTIQLLHIVPTIHLLETRKLIKLKRESQL